MADDLPQPQAQHHDGTGRLLGHLHAYRTAGCRHGAGTSVPGTAGRHVDQHAAHTAFADLSPLQGHAQEPLVAHEQRRRGKRPGAQGGAVRLGRLLGRGDPLQLQRTQGRLFADGLHARLPADQPTEDHLRPLHQRRRHGAEAQGLRHRHPDTERPVSGNGRPDRQGHQSQQQLFHHYRRHAAPEHGHVVQQRRTHGRSPDLARAADVRRGEPRPHTRPPRPGGGPPPPPTRRASTSRATSTWPPSSAAAFPPSAASSPVRPWRT